MAHAEVTEIIQYLDLLLLTEAEALGPEMLRTQTISVIVEARAVAVQLPAALMALAVPHPLPVKVIKAEVVLLMVQITVWVVAEAAQVHLGRTEQLGQAVPAALVYIIQYLVQMLRMLVVVEEVASPP